MITKELKSKGFASFLAVDSPEQSEFVWKKPLFVGDCTIEGGAKLIIRSDGTASWVARGRSTDDDDTLSATFYFFDSNKQKVFPDIKVGPIKIPRGFSVDPLKIHNPNRWYPWNRGFGFAKSAYAKIYSVSISISG